MVNQGRKGGLLSGFQGCSVGAGDVPVDWTGLEGRPGAHKRVLNGLWECSLDAENSLVLGCT